MYEVTRSSDSRSSPFSISATAVRPTASCSSSLSGSQQLSLGDSGYRQQRKTQEHDSVRARWPGLRSRGSVRSHDEEGFIVPPPD